MKQTLIIHKIRAKLGLTNDEYVCLDYLFNNKTANLSVICNDLGLEKDLVLKNYKSLNTKGFIWYNEKKQIVISNKWKDEFVANEEEFEKLWKIHPTGNKKTSKERYSKVVLKCNPSELQIKLSEYLKACKESDTFPKNLETWLNPTKEHWNNPLPQKKVFDAKPIEHKVNYKTF